MNWCYRVKKQSIRDEDGQMRLGYGIEALDTKGCLILSIDDLFLTHNAAQVFSDLCNREELEPIHLREVAENTIVSLLSE